MMCDSEVVAWYFAAATHSKWAGQAKYSTLPPLSWFGVFGQTDTGKRLPVW